ncbi:hypothetical protein JX265_007826 [Neoarthrinium moseri]|uniref:Nephrocystin 3-like N-terminal domain-containing protein n=1 Tax=Neoarthrinium moseri TaxID=1658444 RepID=A0A9P9WJF0_9PEZI|nr:hypothetical protein JX265_007826 [Neoarthrinium moseri]
MLFGVPNFGMEQSHLRAVVHRQPNQALIDDLALGSHYLRGLHEQFTGHSFNHKSKIFWAYETRKSISVVRKPDGQLSRSGPLEIMVSRESATSNLINEDASLTFPINEDHSNIVKFRDDDPICKVVLDKIGEIMNHEIQPSFLTTSLLAGSPSAFQRSKIRTPMTADNRIDLTQSPVQRMKIVASAPVELIIKSLHVPEQNQRFMEIEDRSQHTFEWVFEDENLGFMTWLHSGKGLYWISGKPGSGKSTLMKFISDNPKTIRQLRSWKSVDEPVVASFFFHNRGTVLQKSLEGLLRSILVQILQQRPALSTVLTPIIEKHLDKRFPLEEEVLKSSFHNYMWTQHSLGSALRHILRQNEVSLNMCLFLDALDEYDGSPEVIRDFLRDFLQESYLGPNMVKVCFSSRPWEIFTRSFATESGFEMHKHTSSDIKHYCYQKIDSEGIVDVLRILVPDIVENSRGVFLWTKLALGDLIEVATSVKDIDELERRLRELPRELEAYYEDIVRRCPTTLREQGYALLEIVTRSLKALMVSDLLQILHSSSYSTFEKCSEALYLERKKNDPPTARQLISNACGGLLEITTGSKTVQVMHQTVHEFVLSPRFRTCMLGDLAKFQHENGHSYIAKSMLVEKRALIIDEITLKHCKEVELTTGKSQLDFFKTIPSSSPNMMVANDPYQQFSFAMFGGLHLCLQELVASVPSMGTSAMKRFLTSDIEFTPVEFQASLDLLSEAGFRLQGLTNFICSRHTGTFNGNGVNNLRVTYRDYALQLFDDDSLMIIMSLLKHENDPEATIRSLVDHTGRPFLICNPILMRWRLRNGMDSSYADQYGKTWVDYAVLTLLEIGRFSALLSPLGESTILVLESGGSIGISTVQTVDLARRRLRELKLTSNSEQLFRLLGSGKATTPEMKQQGEIPRAMVQSERISSSSSRSSLVKRMKNLLKSSPKG